MEAVIGVAIVREGRVLAARRTRPAAVAGRWELPGGKVEDGESDAAAGVREIAEELGCTIDVLRRLPGEARISERYVLRVYLARLIRGEPVPGEHDQVRWLEAGELDDVNWLQADLPFVEQLRHELAGEGPAPASWLDERDEGHGVTAREG